MALTTRLFPGDEELGKKDDDHKYGTRGSLNATWQHRRAPLRRNLKRIVLGIAACFLVYIFIKNIPTDVQHRNFRPHYQSPQTRKPAQQGHAQLTPNKERPDKSAAVASRPQSPAKGHIGLAEEEEYSYNGPIKFYNLASTLHDAAALTDGYTLANKNVLFAAANLKSAAILIPMACEMAQWQRNDVHFALIGRDDVDMEMLKNINSVDSHCDVYFHDARPDFSTSSTEYRMEASAAAGLGHINNFLHPQVIIVDNSGIEEDFLLEAFRDRSALLGKPLIELPKDVALNLMWLTRLDSLSLSAWNKVNFDIVIHAQEAASGSLIRLLRSLWHADYFSAPPPRLTIELPPHVDEMTEQFLQTFKWPPSHQNRDANANQLILRHRVTQHHANVDETSLHFVESYWPTNPILSNLLVLSPHTEVSPLYYHYLKYTTLEYRYSLNASSQPQNLFGISLTLPTTYLNDTTAFSAPTNTPFLWQAPNSDAALYFGSAWTELHSLVGNSFESARTLPTPTTLNTKQVSRTYPAWLEHMLMLARVRGYRMLYPQLLSKNEVLATVHHELYHAPEEYSYAMNPDHKKLPKDESKPDISKEFTADPTEHLSLSHPEAKMAKKDLLDVFYPDSLVPALQDLPLLTWDGHKTTPLALSGAVLDFIDIFKREIGGCRLKEEPKAYRNGEVVDLFCFNAGDKTEAGDDSAEIGV